MNPRIKKLTTILLIIVAVYVVGFFMVVPLALNNTVMISRFAVHLHYAIYKPVVNSLDGTVVHKIWNKNAAFWCSKIESCNEFESLIEIQKQEVLEKLDHRKD